MHPIEYTTGKGSKSAHSIYQNSLLAPSMNERVAFGYYVRSCVDYRVPLFVHREALETTE